jgi:predicted lipoprotein with Yx(FWY)xxD motif
VASACVARPGDAWLDGEAPGAAAAIGGVSALALVLLGVAVAGASGPPGAGPPAGPPTTAVLKTTTINGATVLTNGKGLTLYWFAPDTPARSVCTGGCAQYWPPLTGRPAAGPGVTGRLGTITRPDGTAQATYDGHPLYTYIADTALGQAHGNNLNLKAACGTKSRCPAEPSCPALKCDERIARLTPFGAIQAKTTGALSSARHTTVLQ